METKNSAVITEEVRQLYAQYQQGVSSRRRMWPQSIKSRVFQLMELKISSTVIATQTGIPVATIYHWKSNRLRSRAFLQVKVISNKPVKTHAGLSPGMTTQPRRRYRSRVAVQKQGAPTITVVAPNGLRIEGLDVFSVLQIAAQLGLGS